MRLNGSLWVLTVVISCGLAEATHGSSPADSVSSVDSLWVINPTDGTSEIAIPNNVNTKFILAVMVNSPTTFGAITIPLSFAGLDELNIDTTVATAGQLGVSYGPAGRSPGWNFNTSNVDNAAKKILIGLTSFGVVPGPLNDTLVYVHFDLDASGQNATIDVDSTLFPPANRLALTNVMAIEFTPQWTAAVIEVGMGGDCVLPAPPPPLSPPNHVSGLTSTVELEWDALPEADNYRYQVDDDADFSSPLWDMERFMTGDTVFGLIDGTAYSWRVRAHDSCGWGGWTTPPWDFSVGVEPCVPLGAPPLLSPPNHTFIPGPDVVLEWSTLPDADLYQYQVDDDVGFSSPEWDMERVMTGDTLFPTADGTTYYWRVRAHDTCGWGVWTTPAWDFTVGVDTCVPPVAPSLLIPPNHDHFTVTGSGLEVILEWAPVAGTDRYRYQLGHGNDFSSPLVDWELVGTSDTLTLFPTYDTTYYWRVRAHDACGWGPWTDPVWDFSTGPSTFNALAMIHPDSGGQAYRVPDLHVDTNFHMAIMIYSETTLGAITIPLSFAGVAQLNIDTAISTEGEAGITLGPAGRDTGWAMVTSLVNNTDKTVLLGFISFTQVDPLLDDTLVYVHFDLDSSGQAALVVVDSTSTLPSNHLSFTDVLAHEFTPHWSHALIEVGSDTCLLPSPTLLNPAPNHGVHPLDTLVFVWAEMPEAELYRLQIDDHGDFSSPNWDTQLVTTADAVSGFALATRYYWRVRAKNSCGWGTWTEPPWEFFTTCPDPDPPQLLSPANHAVDVTTPVALDWADVAGALEYAVQVYDDSEFTFAHRVWDRRPVVSHDTASLPAGIKYYWQVRTRDPCGWGDWVAQPWDFFAVRADSCLPPASPPLLLPLHHAVGLRLPVVLQWTSASGADRYQVQVDIEAGFAGPTWDREVTQTRDTVTGLLTGATYYWRVRSHDTCGWGPWTNPAWDFTTAAHGGDSLWLIHPVDGTHEMRIRDNIDSNFALAVMISSETTIGAITIPLSFGGLNQLNIDTTVMTGGEEGITLGPAGRNPGWDFVTSAVRNDEKTILIGFLSFTQVDPPLNDTLAYIHFDLDASGLFRIVAVDSVFLAPSNQLAFVDVWANTLTPQWQRADIVVGISVGADDPTGVRPAAASLAQNYPNPFNAQTSISFSVPQATHVNLVVYNVLGQHVSTLVNRPMPAGHHGVTWDGFDGQGQQLASGTYFYRLRIGETFEQTRQMTLLK